MYIHTLQKGVFFGRYLRFASCGKSSTHLERLSLPSLIFRGYHKMRWMRESCLLSNMGYDFIQLFRIFTLLQQTRPQVMSCPIRLSFQVEKVMLLVHEAKDKTSDTNTWVTFVCDAGFFHRTLSAMDGKCKMQSDHRPFVYCCNSRAGTKFVSL